MVGQRCFSALNREQGIDERTACYFDTLVNRGQCRVAIGGHFHIVVADDGNIIIERADGTRPPSRFTKWVGSAGPGLSTDEIMELLRGE